jgi:prepilin-type N-terminal cleavage/methylation domain-containing protein
VIRRLRLGRESGFTLVEMICVCLLLGVVLTGVTTVMVGGSHAELQNNNRFQAQQVARSALDILRNDVHNACTANVASAGALLKLAYVPSNDPTQCGASSANSKVLWCALASPTVTGMYALYRSTASTCTAANGTLQADHLTANTVWSTAATIPVEQLQTITVSIPVSYVQGTYGQAYTLGQTLVLRDTVWQTTGSATACPTTANNLTCVSGLCLYNGASCYPPVIQ